MSMGPIDDKRNLNWFERQRLAKRGPFDLGVELENMPSHLTTTAANEYGLQRLGPFKEESAPHPFAGVETAPPQQQPAQQSAQQQEQWRMPYVGTTPGSTSREMTDPTPEHTALVGQLSQMINSGVSDAEILAWVKKHNLQPTGLDQALAYRRRNPREKLKVVPAGHLKEPPKEISRAEATATGFRGGVLFDFDDEIGGAGDALKYAAGEALATVVSPLGEDASTVARTLLGPEAGERGTSFTDAYAKSRDARREVQDSAMYHHPGYYLGGQVVGGLATTPFTGGAGTLAKGASLGARIRAGATAGGVTGTISGVGAARGDLADRVKGGAIGGTLGTVTGGAFSAAGKGVERLATSERATKVLDAAARVSDSLKTKITPSLAHLGRTGNGAGESQRGRLALGIRSTPAGFVTGLDSKLTKFGDDIEQGVETLAQRTGATSPSLPDAAARQVQPTPGTIAGYTDTSKSISDGLYKNADNLGGGTMIAPTRTVAALDKIEARLALSPGTQESRAAIAELRQELASQQWTVEGLRQLRTTYGKRLNATDGVTRMDSNAMWAELSRDITDGLHRAGKGEAARAYRTADRYYAKRAETKAVVEKIVGGARGGPLHSAERVARNLDNMSRMDADKLSTVLRQLPRAEADDVRGNLLRQMGMANPSKQGDVPTFSIQSFGTQWAKLTPRAKSVLFDKQTVRDLDDLATLAAAAKSIPGNGSNSFNAAASASWTAAGLGGAYAVGQWATGNGETSVALTILATLATGKALGSQRLVRAVANFGRTGKTAPLERALGAAINGAAGNPALQQTLTGVRDMIIQRKEPVVLEEGIQPEAQTSDKSVFDQGATSNRKSIFDEDDGDVGEAAPHPFLGVQQDQEEEQQPQDDRSAAERVADGEGDEPIY